MKKIQLLEPSHLILMLHFQKSQFAICHWLLFGFISEMPLPSNFTDITFTFNGTTFTFSYSHFQVDEQIAAAFKLWSDVTDLTFTPRSYGRLNLKLGKYQTDLDGVCVCESSKFVDCKYFQRSHRNPVPKSVSRRR